MANTPDPVTGWWRRISLRAKVTGVTVAVLCLGLLVAGIGTIPILRAALISNIDAQLPALRDSDFATRLFNLQSDGGTLTFDLRDNARTDTYVAFYDAAGDFIAQSGPSAGPPVAWPDTYSLALAKLNEDKVPLRFETEAGDELHGAVSTKEGPDGLLYVQVVALPLEEADRVIATYFAVYITVTLVTILVAALLIRGLVTLTFRRLGHVESTAMAIASGDFSQRLTDLEPTTEVGRLNTAINTMLDQVDRSLSDRERTVRHMRRFIGDASHELRTPLVSVRGYAELYRMGAIRGEEDTARAMERIEKEAIRMGVLVEDLLALARLDEERELEIVPLDLRPIARDAALDLRAAAPGRTVTVIDTTAGMDAVAPAAPDTAPPLSNRPAAPHPVTTNTRAVSIRGRATSPLARLRRRPRAQSGTEPMPTIDFREAIDAPVRTPPIVLGEENKVRQVVANLLGNARRFSGENDPIEIIVGSDRSRGVATIAIADHGEGVPEQIREQIFQRFWRADSSRARETGGSGLGLAIVQSIVSALNGRVDVTQTPGGGATFTVTLPLAPARSVPEHLLEDTQPLERLDD